MNERLVEEKGRGEKERGEKTVGVDRGQRTETETGREPRVCRWEENKKKEQRTKRKKGATALKKKRRRTATLFLAMVMVLYTFSLHSIIQTIQSLFRQAQMRIWLSSCLLSFSPFSRASSLIFLLCSFALVRGRTTDTSTDHGTTILSTSK